MRKGALSNTREGVSPMKKIHKVFLFTVEDVAEKLGCSRYTVERYIRSGKLRATKLGRVTYVSDSNLTNFLEGYTPERGAELEDDETKDKSA